VDNLKRLRLIYEDSLGPCDYCGVDGAVGDSLKLFEYATEAGLPSPRLGAEFYLRCADRARCSKRVATRLAVATRSDDA
jgi:hypothetical protein